MAQTPNLVKSSALTVVKTLEAWGSETDKFAFLVIIFTDGRDYYYHNYTERRLPSDITLLAAQAIIIPRTYYQAPPPHGLHHAPESLPDHIYLKASFPLHITNEADLSTTRVADFLVQEAQIYHELTKNPHPNISEYFGIYVRDGLMAGLCLRKYSKTLHARVEAGDKMDIESILNGIKSGLDHLHSLDYVHGDINPHNIMFDATNLSVPVIIDFDSCYKNGAKIVGKAGTFGWCRVPEEDTAKFEDDEYGLNAIKSWLEGSR